MFCSLYTLRPNISSFGLFVLLFGLFNRPYCHPLRLSLWHIPPWWQRQPPGHLQLMRLPPVLTLLCHIPPHPELSWLDWLFLHCHQGSCLAAPQALLFHHRKLMDAADENFESDGNRVESEKRFFHWFFHQLAINQHNFTDAQVED